MANSYSGHRCHAMRMLEQRSRFALRKLINWTKYEVSDSHELTFIANTGDPKCFKLRIVTKETDGLIEVAIVEGVLPEAPKHCTAVGKIEKLTVTTEAPAQNLNVRALPSREVELNP